jgi:beta-lactamase regulating signal transducer with metallopeptidase domain
MDTFTGFANRTLEHWLSLVWHAAWQGAVVGLLVLAAVKYGRRWPAPVRYWLLVLALIKFVTPPLESFPTGIFSLVSINEPRFETTDAPFIEQPHLIDDFPLRESASIASLAPAESNGEQAAAPPNIVDQPSGRPARASAKISSPAARNRVPISSAVLVLVHLGGSLIMLGLFVSRTFQLQRACRRTEPPGIELAAMAREIAGRLGLRRVPDLRISRHELVPYSMGALHPVVVLPSRIVEESPPAEVYAVLFHELAHHRRGDLWMNLLQLTISAAWWFHPVVWCLNRAIRNVREECCDDLLLARKFVSDVDYCTALVHVAETCSRRPQSFFGVELSMVDGSHPLTSRIRRIMDETLPRYEQAGARAVVAILALAAVVLPGVRAASTPISNALGAEKQDLAGRSLNQTPVLADDGTSATSIDNTVNTELIAPKPDRILQTGVAVFGRVTNHEGEPVAMATVALGQYFDNFNSPSIAKTGEDGSFHLKHCPPGNSLLTVFKIGLAPSMQTVEVSESNREFNAVLLPGRSLRVRVSDKSGQPIDNVEIAPFKWTDTVTLARLHNFGKTDKNGIWTWEWAPDDILTYRIFKDGYVQRNDLPIPPGAQLHEVQLESELRVNIKVVNSATGKPIPAYSAKLGLVHESATRKGPDQERIPTKVQWLRANAVPSSGGKCTLRHGDFSWGEYVARVEAKGYRSAQSRIYRADENNVTIEFRLETAKQRDARTLTADGTPAEGAIVHIGTSANPVSVRVNQLDPSSRDPAIRTDADGRVRIDVPTDDFTLVVLHESGFARVPGTRFDEEDEPVSILLQPWARIEGTVRKLQTLLPGESVQLDLADDRGESPGFGRHGLFQMQTKSDTSGRFVFDRVPPAIDVVVTHQGPVRTALGPFLGSHHSGQLKVPAGEMRSITLGGTGRAVIGRFQLKDEAWAADWGASIGTLQPAGKPADLNAGDIVYRPAPLFDIEPDGSFRIEDVPPGQYRIAFSLLALKPESSLRLRLDAIPQDKKGISGLLVGTYDVPAAADAPVEQFVDLGTLPVGYVNSPRK